MKLNKIVRRDAGFYCVVISESSRDQLVIRGQSYGSDEQFICTMARQTGNKTAQFKSKCCHMFCPIMEHPVDPNFILEACGTCEVIRSYNVITSESNTICTGCKLISACKGPESSVFVIDREGELLQLEWREDREKRKTVHRIQTGVKFALGMWSTYGMCYMEQSNILVFTFDHSIEAINPGTGSVVWQFTQNVEGKKLDLCGVCCDLDGRLYLADGKNKRLIVLNGKTGGLLQVLLKDDETGGVYGVCWMSSPPQLTVHHVASILRTCNVIEQ